MLKVCDLEIRTSVEWFDLDVDKKTVVVKADCDRTASDIVKELRQILKVSNPTKALQRKMSIGNTPAAIGAKSAQTRSSLIAAPGQLLTDDSSEPELFLFNAQKGVHPRLSFVRLLPTDYPLRMLLGNADPTDKQLSILESKGPNYYLLFINMAAIERYLIFAGDIR